MYMAAKPYLGFSILPWGLVVVFQSWKKKKQEKITGIWKTIIIYKSWDKHKKNEATFCKYALPKSIFHSAKPVSVLSDS